jgi:DNA-binding FrmR family transcriptional regulator
MAMCADKQDVFSRFYNIEEHLHAIRQMIVEGQPCLDVLRQMYAVRKAIEQLEAALLDYQFATCMREGFSSEREEAIIAELVQLYLLVGNR